MKIVFLDRDGTVIRDPEDERVDREDKIELFPDTLEALSLLAQHDYGIVFVTNQAGIAEGRITIPEFERLHTKVCQQLSPSGVSILKTYMCPHAPQDACACRKPKPKLILDALKDFNQKPENIFMVGDRVSDIDAGVAAGSRTILVQTANVTQVAPHATYTARNLLAAVQYILSS